MKNSSKKNISNQKAFTLLEVIVALTILAIALSSIVVSNTQLVRNISHLKNKTVSTWVASNVINEAKIGLIQPPQALVPVYGETTMMNGNWFWRAKFTPIGSGQYEVAVDVGQTTDYNTSTLIGFVEAGN